MGAAIKAKKKVPSQGVKPTNPKDALASNKIPFHLWPETATVVGAMGMLDGALKYGRSNYRALGARASVYYDAARRHLNAMFEGEWIDPESGLPHVAGALASLAIIVDCHYAGNLVDDRMYPGGYHKLLEEMTPHVARLKALRGQRAVKHYNRADGQAQQNTTRMGPRRAP